MKIELQALEHAYPGGDKALDGVDLTLDGNEPVAIIGQNGAGKTTMVKHFNGILRPTGGKVLIDGIDVNERSTAEWSRSVGYVFQNPDDQLFLESVRKEFEFGPRQIGMSDQDIAHRVDSIAELVGLTKKTRRAPIRPDAHREEILHNRCRHHDGPIRGDFRRANVRSGCVGQRPPCTHHRTSESTRQTLHHDFARHEIRHRELLPCHRDVPRPRAARWPGPRGVCPDRHTSAFLRDAAARHPSGSGCRPQGDGILRPRVHQRHCSGKEPSWLMSLLKSME
ncbi:cobalt ABC transporter, ATP-binding family protein [Bifidobacterium longum subsp. longum 35B]|nr:cobalt ABC transporter, ATP-binding family protein [Bifidobacterium longum subsp. longum 35B]